MLAVVVIIGFGLVGAGIVRLTPPDGTLAEFLPPSDSSHDRYLATEAVVQRLTAECMHALELAYEEEILPTPYFADDDLTDRQIAEKWGLRISTTVNEPPVELPPVPDRNRSYADTLPPREKTIYLESLYGSATGEGCLDRAAKTVHGRYQPVAERFDPLLNTLTTQISMDPAIAKAEDDWQVCIRDRTSFDLPRPVLLRVIPGEIASRLERLAQSDSTALARLQAEERAIAVAIVDCDGPYYSAYELVRTKLEPEFVRAHVAELEGLRADWQAIDRQLGVPGHPSTSGSSVIAPTASRWWA